MSWRVSAALQVSSEHTFAGSGSMGCDWLRENGNIRRGKGRATRACKWAAEPSADLPKSVTFLVPWWGINASSKIDLQHAVCDGDASLLGVLAYSILF